MSDRVGWTKIANTICFFLSCSKSQLVSFGPVFVLKLTVHSFCFMENKFIFATNHYFLNFQCYICTGLNVSDGHYLKKFTLVSEVSFILYHTWPMRLRLVSDIYHLLEISLSKEKIHFHGKRPSDTQMADFNDCFLQ